jgi:hypothetical protein
MQADGILPVRKRDVDTEPASLMVKSPLRGTISEAPVHIALSVVQST